MQHGAIRVIANSPQYRPLRRARVVEQGERLIAVAGHHDGIDHVVGVVHGAIFFPIYILLTLDLTRRVRMTPIQLVLTVIAGAVPIGSFYAERRTTQYVRERQAALEAA